MQSKNFEFLRRKWKKLADLGAEAEQLIHSHPRPATSALRTFAEQIVRIIYAHHGLREVDGGNLIDLLTAPAFVRIVRRDIRDKLHHLRIEGNKGAHGQTFLSQTAVRLLQEAHELGCWMFREYGGGSNGECPRFTPPQPQAALSGPPPSQAPPPRTVPPPGKPSQASSLEQCQLTGNWVPKNQLGTCAVSGVRALLSQMVLCEYTGKLIVRSHAGRSDYSRKTISANLLQRSEKPPGRLGAPDEVARCAVTGRLLLLDELGYSVVSHKRVDRDLLHYSGPSAQPALPDEMVICQESNAELLPTEAGVCSITNKTVNIQLLSTSEVSGARGLTRLMQRCDSTGKLVLPGELEQCHLTCKRVLPSELVECAVTGLRGIQSLMVWNKELGRFLLPAQELECEIVAALERYAPYANTYEAIRWAGISLDEFETKAMDILSRNRLNVNSLAELRQRCTCPWLRCLILRVEGRSWDATREAARHLDTESDQARRAIDAIALDLETGCTGRRPLPLEAATIRSRFLGEKWPPGFPMMELQDAQVRASVALLTRLKQSLQHFLS